MKPTPKGWPRMSSAVYYREPIKMIDWLCDAFGFEIRLKVLDDDGQLVHSELTFGEAILMVGGERSGVASSGPTRSSPLSVGGANTQNLMFYLDDVDAHCAHARSLGATIHDEPADHDYGDDYWADRSYGVGDPEGHLWWFTQRLRGG